MNKIFLTYLSFYLEIFSFIEKDRSKEEHLRDIN